MKPPQPTGRRLQKELEREMDLAEIAEFEETQRLLDEGVVGYLPEKISNRMLKRLVRAMDGRGGVGEAHAHRQAAATLGGCQLTDSIPFHFIPFPPDPLHLHAPARRRRHVWLLHLPRQEHGRESVSHSVRQKSHGRRLRRV